MHRYLRSQNPTQAAGWWRRNEARLTPVILLAPACVLFGVFVLYPIVGSIWLSFFAWDGIGKPLWVGLANYAELFRDPVFYLALRNNLIWLAIYMAAPVCGLFLAIFLNQNIAGIRAIRSLFFMPYVISQVLVGLIFGWFFNAEFGLFNRLIGIFGFSPAAPLENEHWAIVVIAVAGLWPQIAYCMILYLTGLTIVDQGMVDAARVDGASGWNILRSVVLPQLKPVTFIVTMVSIVGALRGFDLVMTMTLGGPYNSSTVLAYYMYEQTFLSSRYGYAAAIACVLFVLMWSCIGYFLWRMVRHEKI